MGLLFLSLCTLAATRWHELDGYHFERYRQEFGKMYATAEEAAAREAAFNKKLKEVRSHNAAGHSWCESTARLTTRARHSLPSSSRQPERHVRSRPTVDRKRGVNHLTDRTPEELSVLHGLDRALLFSQKHALSTAKPARPFTKADEVPSGVDWRRQGAVTPVKNQGHCGSCWTFASAETVESRWFLKTGELQDLSEQFILDCTPNPHACGGTGGCGGGTAALAYERLKALGGLPSEWVYPYLAGQTSGGDTKCHGLPLGGLEQPHGGAVAKAANVSGHVSLEPNSYDAVMHALTAGPLAVSVDAGGWHDYEEGVFGGGNHSHPRLDHLVQLVGYGTTPAGADYFLVRNSWTPRWGEGGYMKVARSRDAPCGVDLHPMDGDGCKGGPATVKVCGQSGILYDGVYPLV